MALTAKGRLFVEYYLGEAHGNAGEAARLAGYKDPRNSAYQLGRNPAVRALIDQRVEAVALAADKVLAMLGEQASGTMADFISFDEAGQAYIDLKRASERGKLHLIRKLSCSRDGRIEIELYDAQDALIQLGRYFKLFSDKVEMAETGTVVVEYVNDWRE
jgi:hypothetical protein